MSETSKAPSAPATYGAGTADEAGTAQSRAPGSVSAPPIPGLTSPYSSFESLPKLSDASSDVNTTQEKEEKPQRPSSRLRFCKHGSRHKTSTRTSPLFASKLRRSSNGSSKRRVSHDHEELDEGEFAAGTASSCQLFSMFEAMAAGRGSGRARGGAPFAGTVAVEVDSEMEDDGEPVVEPGMPLGQGPPDEEADYEGGEEESPRTSIDEPRRTPHTETEHGRWVKAEHGSAGAQFTALSMSAHGPFGDVSIHSAPSTVGRSTLSRQVYDTSDEGVMTEDTAASSVPSSPSSAVPTPAKGSSGMKEPALEDERARFMRDDHNQKEKLDTIIAQFGDIAGKMVHLDGSPGDPEQILAESQGTMWKGVVIIGNLHLTTHRLVFHALLPPESEFDTDTQMKAQSEDAARARLSNPSVVQAGPVTIHRSGLKAKKRVWLELTPEMMTTYPAGDEESHNRPLYSVLLSAIIRLIPFDDEHPTDFIFTYNTPTGERTTHFSVDNEHSAIAWRRHFEGTLFRYSRKRFRETHHRREALLMGEHYESQADPEKQWSMLSCCIPLDRITVGEVSQYHSFATLVQLDVKLDSGQSIPSGPGKVVEGNWAGWELSSSERPSEHPSERSSFDLTPRSVTDDAMAAQSHSREGGFDLEHAPARRSLTEDSVARKRRSRFLPSFGSNDSNKARSDKRESVLSNLKTVTSGICDTGASGASSPVESEHSDVPSPSPRQAAFKTSAYLDGTPPPAVMNKAFQEEAEGNATNTVAVLVSVFNDQAWFADVLADAVDAAHQRKYKDGATPAKFSLDVGGYDCLAMDDEIDEHRDSIAQSSDASSLHDDDDEAGKPTAVIEARKREKAAMAARVFGLREDEGIWLKRCYIGRVAPARGHIILTPRYLCFWRRANVGADIKYRFSIADVKGAEAVSSMRIKMYGLNVKIHGQEDLHFEFWKKHSRNEVQHRINELVRHVPLDAKREVVKAEAVASEAPIQPVLSNSSEDQHGPVHVWQQMRGMKLEDAQLQLNPASVRDGTADTMKQAAEILAPPPDMLLYPKALPDEALSYMPFVANRPWQSKTGWNTRLTPRRFTMLTIGSRGDVQPYIALALRLMEDGHSCVIVTHDEFKTWIESYGIEHRQAGGDPTALMKLSTDHAMFSPGFFKEALGGFRRWLDELLVDSWNACQDADVLIESPSAMAGVHIAEGLAKKYNKQLPYFRAFTMPWTRTSAYPQAFMVPQIEMGPSFNYSTYVLFDNIMWRASSGQINKWRKVHLGLKSTDQSILSINKVPFLYNFSPAVVPKPLDWDDDIAITGYWNLDNSDMDWTPPASLEAFMAKAKADGKPIVYIGFGSIIVPDPHAVTKSIVKGVEKAGVRAIIAKGWSARLDDGSKKVDETPLPPSCYSVDKVPHTWLFPNIQAAMHHGGAGTTGASLRAGIPTLIKPWFGDQYFWALRVTKLGVGARVSSLRSDDIADALIKATTSRVMIEKAGRIGERIRAENGVDNAVQAIHFNIVRAARDRRRLRKVDSEYASGPRPGVGSKYCAANTKGGQGNIPSRSGTSSGTHTPSRISAREYMPSTLK